MKTRRQPADNPQTPLSAGISAQWRGKLKPADGADRGRSSCMNTRAPRKSVCGFLFKRVIVITNQLVRDEITRRHQWRGLSAGI